MAETVHKKRRLSSSQIIILGFLGVILLGAVILTLPISSAAGKATPFGDALFTATSAVCVTGLVVYDTATYWSSFGHAVLLILIQIGGLGVITVAALISMAAGRRISLMQRNTMQDAISAPQIGGIVRLTRFIIKSVLIIELVGAVLLSPVFCRDFGFWNGLWKSLFHSISAFCNAGFDLMGTRGEFSSLTSYAANPVINTVIMLLIVIGGIGFLTWEDIKVHKFKLRKYKMQSKVALTVSGILIFVPAVYFFFFEFGDTPPGERVWLALFQSVTTRTAGFNTYDLSSMSETGQMVMSSLMLVGGSPGSTAGGMKTTTLAVMTAAAVSVFKRRQDAQFFGRRVAENTVRNAAAIFLMYITLLITGSCIICTVEGLPFTTCLFETASAVGTVGLTLGITPTLSPASHIILMALMFFGRVGALTLVYAAVSESNTHSKLPQEKITVG